MTTAVIVQARMGSTRLPGKVMLDLAGKPILQHVLDRCAKIPSADVVVCAIPDDTDSRPLEDVARACGSEVFKGPEDDVLARYYGAAQAAEADVVMRVTSDCPLIDPLVCGSVLNLRWHEQSDYATNNLPRSFPHGLDCEAFTWTALADAYRRAVYATDREHVTPWLRRSAALRRSNLRSGDDALAGYRWTLDYPEDFAFFAAVMAEFPHEDMPLMNDIINLLKARPDIVELNAKHRVPVDQKQPVRCP